MAEEAAAVAAPPPADVEASQNGEQSTEDAAASTSSGPLSVEDAEKECKRQIEFYFGDSNLPYDKFLFTLQAKNDGWVPLATLTSFKRMRAIKDALSLERIAEIMQDSTEVTVSDDKASVKRARPLVRPTDSFERSAYVKGFPEETETLQQELEQFFAQFGKINSVRMRRDAASKPKRNAFKGSVFVEFAEVADMEALLAKGAKESEPIKYGDAELKVMSKDAYCTMKMIEKGLDPSTMQRGSGGNKPSTSSAMNKKFNAFKEIDRHSRGLPSVLGEGNQEQERRNKKEDEEERRRKAKEDRVKPLEFDFMESKLTTLPDGTVEAETVQFPAQSVLAFTGAGQGGSWRDLKDTLVTMHPTSFVEFPNGAVEGAVGFKSTVNDDILKEIQAKGITVGGQVVEWSRVDEERAKKFYLDRANFRAAFLVDQRELREAEGAAFGDRRQFGHGARGGGGRGRGGRGGGRGGRGGRGGGRGGGGNRQGGQGNDQKRKRDGDNGSAADSNAPPVIASAKKAKTDA